MKHDRDEDSRRVSNSCHLTSNYKKHTTNPNQPTTGAVFIAFFCIVALDAAFLYIYISEAVYYWLGWVK